MRLDILECAACKRLVASDLAANQHEMIGVAALKPLFGDAAKVTVPIVWVLVSAIDPVVERSKITYYDARAKTSGRTGRSEWRLCYRGRFMTYAAPGDLLLLAKAPQGAFAGLLCPRGSPEFNEVSQISPNASTNSFRLVSPETLSETTFIARSLAAALEAGEKSSE